MTKKKKDKEFRPHPKDVEWTENKVYCPLERRWLTEGNYAIHKSTGAVVCAFCGVQFQYPKMIRKVLADEKEKKSKGESRIITPQQAGRVAPTIITP